MQSLFHQLIRTALRKRKFEIVPEIGYGRIGCRVTHLHPLFVQSRNKKGKTIMMRVLDGQENKVPKCLAQAFPGIRQIIEFVMQLGGELLVEFGAEVTNQSFFVRKVPIHGHLRAADLLRNAADRNALIAKLAEEAAGRFK